MYDHVCRMLLREEELRLCEATQSAFFTVRHEPNGMFDVLEKLQTQVAGEFGMEESEGVYVLRHAEQYVGVEKARELSLYRRNNICVDGNLAVGAVAPFHLVPPLRRFGGGVVSLQSLPKPLVLLGGSIT